MSGRPSLIQQREVKQMIKAARQAGAKQVEVRHPNGVAVIVHLDVEDETPIPDEPITRGGSASKLGGLADAVRRDVKANGTR